MKEENHKGDMQVSWKRNLGRVRATQIQKEREDGSQWDKMLIGRSYLDKQGKWQPAQDYDAADLLCLAVLSLLACWQLLKRQGES